MKETGTDRQECRIVRLTITGQQTDPQGHTQENSSVFRAEYIPCGDGHLFRYPEEGGDGEMSSLFVSRGLVRMKRAGGTGTGKAGGTSAAEGTEMVFDPSVSVTQCSYRTPFGVIPMEIRTDRIAVLDGSPFRPVQARIRYTLQMDAGYALQCRVTIRAEKIRVQK